MSQTWAVKIVDASSRLNRHQDPHPILYVLRTPLESGKIVPPRGSVLRHRCKFRFPSYWLLLALFALPFDVCSAQDSVSTSQSGSVTTQEQLSVNWLYGAYVPKDVPLKPLTGSERYKLFVRQSFTTPGIYIRTGIFSLHDQVRDVPPEWDSTFEGLAKRIGTRHTQYLLENSFKSLGYAAVGWEPRYDRCKCDGFWRRTRHALARSFVTYDRSEEHLRPQVMPYLGAFGAGVITSTWEPGHSNHLVKGYQSALTQVWWGGISNLLGEFGPDIARKLKKHKK